MRLDYGTLLSKEPIKTGIGTIEPPTLNKIRREIGFDIFSLYEMYLRITPKIYYNLMVKNGKEKWKSLSKGERKSIQMYDIVLENNELHPIYEEIFNFFFSEQVVFLGDCFAILNKQDIDRNNISIDDVKGVVCKDNFVKVLSLLQQVCGFEVKDEEESKKPLKFKNDRAKELYEKIYGKNEDDSDEMDEAENDEVDYNLTLPNIISAVSNCHPTISPLNVWELTVFQLVDSFHRVMQNKADDINRTSVAVWGDEDNKFKNDQWLRNRYDVKDEPL